MDLTEEEWDMVMEMYADGMFTFSIEKECGYTPEEIDAYQALFHKIVNMKNEVFGNG